MRNLLRALFGSLTARRERVVALELKKQHAIDLTAPPAPACTGVKCQDRHRVKELSDRMHKQSHRLHVLQWHAEQLSARITDEPEEPIIVPMQSARPS